MEESIKRAAEKEFVKKAPDHFTDKVMQSVFECSIKPVVKPLISTRGWILVAVFIVGLVVLVVQTPLSSDADSSSWFSLSRLEPFLNRLPEWSFQLPEKLTGSSLFVLMSVSLALLFLFSFDLILSRRSR
ncbi:MAG TPA: hypothetical protein PLK12_10985 [Prolixibacteraceae bacterium]|nr:hypothetical protein [Prolixibacteraceae bacterium]